MIHNEMTTAEMHAAVAALTGPQRVALAVKLLIQDGVPADKALDIVCGEGTFTKLAGDVWEAARATARVEG